MVGEGKREAVIIQVIWWSRGNKRVAMQVSTGQTRLLHWKGKCQLWNIRKKIRRSKNKSWRRAGNREKESRRREIFKLRIEEDRSVSFSSSWSSNKLSTCCALDYRQNPWWLVHLLYLATQSRWVWERERERTSTLLTQQMKGGLQTFTHQTLHNFLLFPSANPIANYRKPEFFHWWNILPLVKFLSL